MRSLRQVLGVLWTVVAAVPFAARPEAPGDSATPSVSAPNRAPRSDTRASLGSARIGLGESLLRDLKAPFVAAPGFRLRLTTRITRSDGQTVSRSDGPTLRHSYSARAPPDLH